MASLPRQAIIVLALIIGVAAPAVMSVTAYQITKNPSLRPLARTENDMAIFEGKHVVNQVMARVSWPTGQRRNFTKQELATAIRNGFSSHGVSVRIEVDLKSGTGPVMVAYTVGANRFKPQPVHRAADGVKTAVTAYRMYQQQAPEN